MSPKLKSQVFQWLSCCMSDWINIAFYDMLLLVCLFCLFKTIIFTYVIRINYFVYMSFDKI